MTTRKELVEALRVRYASGAFGERIKILDEFVAVAGYHRKHAIRVLREQVGTVTAASPRNRLYDEAVGQALTVLWEAADRLCGKRLKALIPMLIDAMERHGHLDLDPVIKTKVLQVSAATIIDRVLAPARLHIDGQRTSAEPVGNFVCEAQHDPQEHECHASRTPLRRTKRRCRSFPLNCWRPWFLGRSRLGNLKTW